jgi:hypothetical protein
MLEHYSDIHKDCYGSRPTADMRIHAEVYRAGY